MPRRNRRELLAEATRVDDEVLGDDYRFIRDRIIEQQRDRNRRLRAKQDAERWAATVADWTQCIIGDCKFSVPPRITDGIDFPICSVHAAAVWRHVEALRTIDPTYLEAIVALHARADLIEAEKQTTFAEGAAAYEADRKAGIVDGDIYFVRTGGLIKVGWSAEVGQRLRAYPPGSVLLVVYPGTRQDETTLHQQLTPSRAHGREWYHDDSIIARFVEDAVAKYGPPPFKIQWSTAEPVVGSKGRRHL